jgi:hypothetical protein
VSVLWAAGSTQAQEVRARGVPADVLRAVEVERQGGRVSEYWVGLECYPVDGALGAQLGLPGETGLVVERVSPDSPAEKAAFKQYDVIVQAGDAPMKSVADLIAQIEDAGEKELAVQVIRGGQKMTVRVAPEKRPGRARIVPGDRTMDPRAIGEMLERLGRARQPGDRFNFQIWRPGAVFPDRELPKLPKDMKISITKQGDSPATITIERGDQRWEAAENKLSELPDDVRPHVEAMLGHGQFPCLRNAGLSGV